ncbi:hypothetical protein [Sporichthya sp.]|uniref:hypothetical protein n=1 Tax=Sporichthya sp. TaxID=65475 RepID=UPI00182B0739|nr:hypothetical protein [Sporichthya sp.]MBA3742495.1 hypothetical protein [Sporichthya sp.]
MNAERVPSTITKEAPMNVSPPEWIAGLPELHDNLVRDRRDALVLAADATLDLDELGAETWAAIAARSDGDLLRIEAQLVLVDRHAARLLEAHGHDEGVSSE